MFGGNILMKTIFRVFMLGLVTVTFGAVATFAQDAAATTTATTCTFEMQQKLYGDWNKYKKSNVPAELKLAIKAGQEFLEKCSTPDQDAVVKHLQTNVPIQIARLEELELTECFNNSLKDRKNYNADEAYRCGKTIAGKKPDFAFDIGIALAMVGYENSLKTPPVDKYNVETINFAKKVISDAEAGKTSNTFGVWSWSTAVQDAQKKTDALKSKPNTIAWMNYVIGSIMYFNQKSEKDALPFFYKASQIDSPVKNFPVIYQSIGAYYLKELRRIDKERLDKIVANKNEDNEETLALLAMEKGLADRAINAYSKAHKLAKAEAKTQPQLDYVKSLYDILTGLYEVRFGKTDGFEVHINTVAGQPLVDPATPVTPVVETPTTTPTTVNSSSTPTTGATTKPATTPTTKPATTPVTTKPATTTPTKPTSTTTKPATKSKSTVNKKKGAR